MISDFIFNLIQRISFIKKYRFYDFCKDIVFPFFIKNISKIFKDKIDEKLIILGAYGGGAFVDNTKYLFKFLTNRTDYNVIWVTKFNEITSTVRKLGGIAVPFYNINTIKLLRRAKYIFMTHGYIDVMPIDFSPKTTIFMTWHGTPIKIIVREIENSYRYGKWGRILRLKLRDNEYIDYLLTAAGGKNEQKILSSSFKITQRKIVTLGYPKNDILFNKEENFINNIKNYYDIPFDIKRIFIYAPTFREDRIFNFPLSKNELSCLNDFLKKTNSQLLIKAHLFEQRINFDSYKNIRIVDKKSDLQELLLISDALITDYSSVIFDYLLTMKPILLFTYDLEKYKKEWGMHYNFEEIAPGPLLFNGKDLIDGIKNIDKIDKEFKERREKIRNRFNKYNDGKSIIRLLNFLNIKYS